MANVNFFSPDGGTTRYPIEDTEARSRIAGQQNQLNAQGVLGAKNLLQITATTRTQDGVTITVNKDSSDNVLSVVLNGTATSSGQFNLNNTSGLLNSLLQEYGDLIWSGCPSRTDCRMYTHILNGSYVTLTNNEEKILSASNNYDNNILVQYDNGVTYDNVAFYPMLRLASDPDDTYQPYAMTNRELTEKVFEKRVLTSADDLNNITETGIYGIRDSAPANMPEGQTWGSLLVNKVNTNNIQQQFFKAELLYQRTYRGATPTWTSWYKFTGTVVS